MNMKKLEKLCDLLDEAKHFDKQHFTIQKTPLTEQLKIVGQPCCPLSIWAYHHPSRWNFPHEGDKVMIPTLNVDGGQFFTTEEACSIEFGCGHGEFVDIFSVAGLKGCSTAKEAATYIREKYLTEKED